MADRDRAAARRRRHVAAGLAAPAGDGGGPAWRAALDDVPDEAFVDTDGDPVDEVDDAREEVADTLELLSGWVTRVPDGESLILVTRGDL